MVLCFFVGGWARAQKLPKEIWLNGAGILFNDRSILEMVQQNSLLTHSKQSAAISYSESRVDRGTSSAWPKIPHGARGLWWGLGVGHRGNLLGFLNGGELDGHTETSIYQDWTRTRASALPASPQEKLLQAWVAKSQRVSVNSFTAQRGAFMELVREQLVFKWSLDWLLISAFIFKSKVLVINCSTSNINT